MTGQILLLDVDDVTAQFRKKFIEVANNTLGTNFTLENGSFVYECEKALNLTKTQNSKVWVEINKKGFATELELMPGAGDAIERIASKGYEVAFATSPLKSSETWVSDRRKWVRKHFGPLLADRILTGRPKYMIDADYFIDDRVDMIEQWERTRIERCGGHRKPTPILFAWPYNVVYAEVTGTLRLHDWGQILERLQCN